MVGRITSNAAPATNEHGVPYLQLFRQERESSSRLIERMTEALRAWQAAESEAPNSRRRRSLLSRARALTESVLN